MARIVTWTESMAPNSGWLFRASLNVKQPLLPRKMMAKQCRRAFKAFDLRSLDTGYHTTLFCVAHWNNMLKIFD